MNRRKFFTQTAALAALAAVPKNIVESDDDFVDRMWREGKPIIGHRLKLSRPIRLSGDVPGIVFKNNVVTGSGGAFVILDESSKFSVITGNYLSGFSAGFVFVRREFK